MTFWLEAAIPITLTLLMLAGLPFARRWLNSDVEWEDKPDDLTKFIEADRRSKSYRKRYARAQELVGNRYSKGALVALVAYLLKSDGLSDT